MTESIERSQFGVYGMRDRAEIIYRNLRARLATLLPRAMRKAEIDMWILVCQEDNIDPVYATMIPMDTWCPILQILVFHDRGADGVEGINLSGVNTRGLYLHPYKGQDPDTQWRLLAELVAERCPRRIGVNTGSVAWSAGGLTWNLREQLVGALPSLYADRLVSAEPAAVAWLAELQEGDASVMDHVVGVAQRIIAHCYSNDAVTPGVTTLDDLIWHYWDTCASLGLDVSFTPHFDFRREPEAIERFGVDDRVVREGDLLHCDVGIRYMRMHSDHQQWAYVLRDGEKDAPAGARELMREMHRLQGIYMGEFLHGRTGNEILAATLARAAEAGVPNPKVASHSLGFCLHEPGPLIGLPWEQVRCPGRGDVRLEYGNAFTMELVVTGTLPEWGGAPLRFQAEEDILFTREGVRIFGERQSRFYLIGRPGGAV